MAIAPLSQDSLALQAATLLSFYNFDLEDATAPQAVLRWLDHFPARWIRPAVIEALYQGRYKAISVEQILVCWQRRGQTILHFNHEFERIVCHQLSGSQSDKPTNKKSISVSLQPQTPNSSLESESSETSQFINAEHPNPSNRPSIQQFIPVVTSANFYARLKAVANSSLSTRA